MSDSNQRIYKMRRRIHVSDSNQRIYKMRRRIHVSDSNQRIYRRTWKPAHIQEDMETGAYTGGHGEGDAAR